MCGSDEETAYTCIYHQTGKTNENGTTNCTLPNCPSRHSRVHCTVPLSLPLSHIISLRLDKKYYFFSLFFPHILCMSPAFQGGESRELNRFLFKKWWEGLNCNFRTLWREFHRPSNLSVLCSIQPSKRLKNRGQLYLSFFFFLFSFPFPL